MVQLVRRGGGGPAAAHPVQLESDLEPPRTSSRPRPKERAPFLLCTGQAKLLRLSLQEVAYRRPSLTGDSRSRCLRVLQSWARGSCVAGRRKGTGRGIPSRGRSPRSRSSSSTRTRSEPSPSCSGAREAGVGGLVVAAVPGLLQPERARSGVGGRARKAGESQTHPGLLRGPPEETERRERGCRAYRGSPRSAGTKGVPAELAKSPALAPCALGAQAAHGRLFTLE